MRMYVSMYEYYLYMYLYRGDDNLELINFNFFCIYKQTIILFYKICILFFNIMNFCH